MSQIAIKGHATRGREVIELLEMLGGKNKYHINITEENLLYTIRKDDNVIIATYPNSSISKIFSIEEFLEKFPYKVGDKVVYQLYGIILKIKTMFWNTEKEQVFYRLDCNKLFVASVDELKPYKEETMEEKTNKALAPDLKGEDYSGRRFGYKIPNGYEFDCIKNNEIIIKPKQPQYPKTYDECCEELGHKEIIISGYVLGYKGSLLSSLQKLLICRDAYWKIAGEWKPNWSDTFIYSIDSSYGVVGKRMVSGSGILVFPTEEMRDTFYENFKDLIEQCKELL